VSVLSRRARETIRFWYFGDDQRIRVTIAGYIRRAGWVDGKWHGDSCGCSDDRCIGYHHDEWEECGCLPAELERWVTEQRADLAAAPIWAAYRAAVEANDGRGDEEAYEAAWAAAEAWVREYHGAGLVSFSLDALVDGRRGISTRNIFNDLDHLVWAVPA
jgi:hypothetical protein